MRLFHFIVLTFYYAIATLAMLRSRYIYAESLYVRQFGRSAMGTIVTRDATGVRPKLVRRFLRGDGKSSIPTSGAVTLAYTADRPHTRQLAFPPISPEELLPYRFAPDCTLPLLYHPRRPHRVYLNIPLVWERQLQNQKRRMPIFFGIWAVFTLLYIFLVAKYGVLSTFDFYGFAFFKSLF